MFIKKIIFSKIYLFILYNINSKYDKHFNVFYNSPFLYVDCNHFKNCINLTRLILMLYIQIDLTKNYLLKTFFKIFIVLKTQISLHYLMLIWLWVQLRYSCVIYTTCNTYCNIIVARENPAKS